MTEYIVKVENLAKLRKLAGLHVKETIELTSGKVVRCRDCEHMSEHHYRDMLGFGRETIVYRCDYFWNADELPEVEPDGFCAWAERKEGGDD